MECPRCHEEKQLTHRIKSDKMNWLVCYECGVDAEVLQGKEHSNEGAMTIQLVEEKRNYEAIR